ncbi:MAG: hypothetical protein HRT88_09490, partial [Lentisphaeraceae bacterium]|nr:hypothetical protein [Lentisphaeraceae bacterium]
MAFTGPNTTLDQRQFLHQLLDVTNEASSFVGVMDMLGRYEATANPIYRIWKNTETFAEPLTVTGAPTDNSGSAQTDFTISVNAADAAKCRKGQLVLTANQKVAIVYDVVTTVGSEEVSVKSVDGSALDLSDTQKIAIISQASGEGSGAPSGERWGYEDDFNQIHILKRQFEITDIELGNKIEIEFEGKPYVLYPQQFQAKMKFDAEISNALMFSRMSAQNFQSGSPTLVDDQGNPIQTTKGLDQHVT